MDPEALARMAAVMGAALAMGAGGVGAALGEGWTAGAALEAVERQPAATSAELRTMLVGQAMAESSSIFALIMALLLLFTDPGSGLARAAALLSAGLCMGVGAVGPGVGAGGPSARVAAGVARNPRRQSDLMTLMLVGQAVCQTPAVFALLVSLLLLYAPLPPGAGWVEAAALLGAGISMGFGALGPGIGSGMAASGGAEAGARRPELASLIMKNMVAGQAVSQSTAIYALVVALLLIRAV